VGQLVGNVQPRWPFSLEVRWILPGELQTVVARWFTQFTGGTDSRQDTYLVSPHLSGLSVKVRGGRALEVKVYQGGPGILVVPGRARGRMESWQKWSFPCGRLVRGGGEAAGWQRVHKRRRIGWFAMASEPVLARAPAPGGEPGCLVELLLESRVVPTFPGLLLVRVSLPWTPCGSETPGGADAGFAWCCNARCAVPPHFIGLTCSALSVVVLRRPLALVVVVT